MGTAERKPKILFVEGSDDKHVVYHLRRQKLPNLCFAIQEAEGVDKLLESVSLQVKVRNRTAVGFLLDANDEPIMDAKGKPAGRWRAVSDRLCDAGIRAPRAPSRGGTIMKGPPRVGVWLMPDNRSTGELEDFVQKMIPEDDPAWELAQQYIRDIPEEARKFLPKKQSRAELHAWLATRENPGLMGAAIGRGDLETGGRLCTDFLRWLKALFA